MNSKYDFYLFSSNISVVAARLTTLSSDISDRGVGISFESLIGLTLSFSIKDQFNMKSEC